MGITNSVGITRKTMTSTAVAYSHRRARCVIWVSVAGRSSQLMIATG